MIISTLRVDPPDPLFFVLFVVVRTFRSGRHRGFGWVNIASFGVLTSLKLFGFGPPRINLAVGRALMLDRFNPETGLAGSIADLVAPVLDDLGFRVVRVEVSRRDGMTVQVMAEREDGTISIDDCETISRQLSPILDVHDPIAGKYRLEVSSPGIDRPLVRPADFEAWAGYEARIGLKEPIDGRKRFHGRIEGFEDGEARIEVDLGEDEGLQVIGLPVGLIGEARLVLTDELVREALSRAKQRKTKSVGDGSDADGLNLEAKES